MFDELGIGNVIDQATHQTQKCETLPHDELSCRWALQTNQEPTAQVAHHLG
jgi:hypothetical protein